MFRKYVEDNWVRFVGSKNDYTRETVKLALYMYFFDAKDLVQYGLPEEDPCLSLAWSAFELNASPASLEKEQDFKVIIIFILVN